MSHYNGGTAARNAQGVDPDGDRERLLDECFGVEGVYAADLTALDAWLGGLSEDDWMTVADGEEGERVTLMAGAPAMSGGSADDFVNTLYEHTV